MDMVKIPTYQSTWCGPAGDSSTSLRLQAPEIGTTTPTPRKNMLELRVFVTDLTQALPNLGSVIVFGDLPFKYAIKEGE